MHEMLQDRDAGVMHRSDETKPGRSVVTWLVGHPLPTADAPHQTIGKLVGLAVFASDAMSSTAYATQEILAILALAGLGAYYFAFPISIAIVILLAIVTLSYEQTIHAYPTGGGSYIVARDNLGTLPAQTAGASLLVDYVLTVAVSVSSGVAQIVSAVPGLFPYRVPITIGLIFFIMLINLRGVKESGAIFAVPSYFFIVMMYLTVIVGFVRFATGNLGTVSNPPPLEAIHDAQGIGIFLLLRAFASGTAAMTGTEAISNGITAFRQPRSKNAGTTLLWMSAILGSLLLAITFLAAHMAAIPSEQETVISQVARTTYGNRGLLYAFTIAGTSLILILAANTAFADFPRLSAILGTDGFLPRQFAFRGSRLVFSRGIVSLAVIASVLVVAFNASVSALIPLYAIGVFVAFTLSQAGMAHRWWKSGRLKPGEELKEQGSTLHYDARWRTKMLINGFGAVCTGIVTIVFSITKFRDGAWIIVFVIPAIIYVLSSIHRHYQGLAGQLSLDAYGAPARVQRHRVIVPIGGVHRGSLEALRYARYLSYDVTAVHVSIDPDESQRIKEKWSVWGEGTRLVILDSPYRVMLKPLLRYVMELAAQRQPDEIITVVVPQFVSGNKRHELLHMRTADLLRQALLLKPGIVITDVPYQVQ